MAIIKRSPQSRVDYLDIWFWIAEAAQQTEPADAMLRRFDDALEMLKEHPQAGPQRPEVHPQVRSWPVRDYVLFYFVIDDGIYLARVLHGSRNLPAAFADQA